MNSSFFRRPLTAGVIKSSAVDFYLIFILSMFIYSKIANRNDALLFFTEAGKRT
jgi:hypothetical protein